MIRKREVELGSIDMAKAVEAEKRAIADIIRARVAVDKTVAVEEEAIKDLRTKADAERQKQVTITTQAKATGRARSWTQREMPLFVSAASGSETPAMKPAMHANACRARTSELRPTISTMCRRPAAAWRVPRGTIER